MYLRSALSRCSFALNTTPVPRRPSSSAHHACRSVSYTHLDVYKRQGSQRIRTLAAFVSNELVLEDLDKLTRLNGLQYKDIPESRRRKINNTPIRMIVLSESATEDVRNDLFERINRGSDLLRNMEKRKGIYRGPFNKFIYDSCAKNPTLVKLAPLAKSVENRQELEELILRFFALIDQYPNFRTHRSGIGSVLDEYIDERLSLIHI